MKARWLVVPLWLLGCQTKVEFHNGVPNASITNYRWESSTGESYYTSSETLAPGETSSSVIIREPDEGKEGKIHFELVVNGRKVALVTDSIYTAEREEITRFDITPETVARNPLASERSDSEPVPADP